MNDLSKTIPQLLTEAAQRWPDLTAILDEPSRLSYPDLLCMSEQTAKALIVSGLEFGDRFAIWAPNIHEWVYTAMGGMMAGGILVPLNTRYRGIEAGDILRRSKSKFLFTSNGFLDTDYPAMLEQEALPDLQQTILLRGECNQPSDQTNEKLPTQEMASFLVQAASCDAAQFEARLEQLSPQSVSDIMYTSGTTGAPKGVVSTHGQTVAIFDLWSKTVGLTEGDQYLIVNPFFHSFGYKAGWLSSLIRGATAIPMSVFDPAATLAIIEEQKINVLPGAPTIFQSLLAHPSLQDTDTSSLRCSVTGAASVPEQLVYDMKNVLGFEEVFTAYGLTECPVVSITRAGDDIALIANTAGKALDDTEVTVVDDAGEPIPADQTGNIKVRGFNVMQGYFDDLNATQATIDENGWLDTGDIGWMDGNGYLKVTDRAKDMFICGGFNCYPAEIENLLLRHPNIIDVAVTGMPDDRLGEVGCAYLVISDDAVALSDLRDWARQHMANFKVPRRFVVAKELPRNASGKVQKFKLSEMHNTHELT